VPWQKYTAKTKAIFAWARLYNPRVPLEIDLAHRRYAQQAAWTQPARAHLLAAAGLPNAARVLEVGCGTGAVLRTLPNAAHMALYGLDIDRAALRFASNEVGEANLTGGDAHRLPYSNAAFDITFCHFVLLWLHNPKAALAEMSRVTRPGGAVLALAEPDYSQRVDTPAELAPLGAAQTAALRAQGAEPAVGGRLPQLFEQAGFQNAESGKLDLAASAPTDWELEHEVLRADLDSMPDVKELLEMDRAAWQAGTRILHVPTFYAWARVT
jgi:ubiquinone/menaquinone biosynthesis C-methylase UbiE